MTEIFRYTLWAKRIIILHELPLSQGMTRLRKLRWDTGDGINSSFLWERAYVRKSLLIVKTHFPESD